MGRRTMSASKGTRRPHDGRPVAGSGARASPGWPASVEKALEPLELSLPQYRVLSLLADGSHRVVGAGRAASR